MNKKRKTKKTIKAICLLVVLVFVFGFSLPISASGPSSASSSSSTGTKARLEIVYPKVPQATLTDVDLQQYTKYIFYFSISIIGFIILGVFIYSGFLYLSSKEDPNKTKEARERMISSLFGAGILLFSYILFNTINPQLLTINPSSLKEIPETIAPGVYMCNYKSKENIESLIKSYKELDPKNPEKDEIEKVKKIWKVIYNDDRHTCFLVRSSGDLNFTFKEGFTVFQIPTKRYDENGNVLWDYKYGLILHENYNHRGKIKILSYRVGKDILYGEATEGKSITLFEKIKKEDIPEDASVTIYKCENYNDESLCPKDIELTTPKSKSYKTPTTPTKLKDDGFDFTEKQGIRSIKITPPKSFIAILCSEENLNGECELFDTSQPSLSQHPINKCGQCRIVGGYMGSWSPYADRTTIKVCEPCAKSIFIIRGKVL
ncbi:MAG TPA: hypothetical protein ENL27_02510 [Candidatus Parcubacteria bacterium]|nr:hypothetical protein [Candidatus Parcubacteria bacterium]